MIKNERQYRVTKAQAEKFASALRDIEARSNSDPLLVELEGNALRSQLDELRQQLDDYDQLRSGERGVITVESFDELPSALVQARIASGLSQKELADRLGLKEQQVQRYEATNYESASLSRLQEIVSALGVSVREELFLPQQRASATFFFNRLNTIGIDREFVLRRLLPPAIAQRLASKTHPLSETDVRHAAATVGRVFDWKEEDVFSGNPLKLRSEVAGIARFKLPARANERRVSAYTVYAHYLALLVLQATPELEPKPVPIDAEECRDSIVSQFGTVTFENVLKYIWGLGIPVLPLNDAGTFYGACWRAEGRNVIVLKQKTMSLARWTDDALHETYHAGQEPEAKDRSIIEEDEMSAQRRESDEEQEAIVFAGEVMLDGRAEELAQMCVEAAGGRVQRLKSVVPMIARNEDVEVDALANYMAFRLSLQEVNWWGAATNLQHHDASPWEIARDCLVPKLNFKRLNDLDRQILLQALTDAET
jgi:transcriptional regulator with XRE-family HTH domain